MKKLNCLFLCILLSLCFCYKVNAQNFEINSKHAILYNLNDNTVLFEKASTEKTYVASLTKIMTSIVAIENIEDFNAKVTLTPNVFYGLAEANASVAGFRIGQQVTYWDLLMGTMLPSGADAARGLAINIAGSEKEFVILMNQKAKELNLNNTNFVNITGLDIEGHYSTVEDIAILLQYALKNPIFKEIYTTREYTTTNGLRLNSTLKRLTSQTSLDTSHIIGTKTGYTDGAGLCLSSIANYNNVNYLLVTTGADPNANSPLQLLDALTIYNYYSSNYSYQEIIVQDQKITDIPVQYSFTKNYSVTSPKTISKYLPNNFDKNKITYVYDGIQNLSYKNKYLQELGTIKIIYNDEELDTIPIHLTKNITFNFLPFIIQTKTVYIIILIFIVLSYVIYKKLKKKKEKTL